MPSPHCPRKEAPVRFLILVLGHFHPGKNLQPRTLKLKEVKGHQKPPCWAVQGLGLLFPAGLSPTHPDLTWLLPVPYTHLPPNCPNRNLSLRGRQSLTVPHLHTFGCSPPLTPSPFSHCPRFRAFEPAVSQTLGHRGHSVLHPCSVHPLPLHLPPGPVCAAAALVTVELRRAGPFRSSLAHPCRAQTSTQTHMWEYELDSGQPRREGDSFGRRWNRQVRRAPILYVGPRANKHNTPPPPREGPHPS